MIALLGGFLKVWGFKMLFYTGVLAVGAALLLGQTRKIGRLEAETMSLRAENALLQNGVSALRGAITFQNDEIERWKAMAARQRAVIEKAQDEARGMRASSEKAARVILAEPVPSECDEAMRWLAAKAKEQAEW